MPLALLQQQSLQRPIAPFGLPSSLSRASSAKALQGSSLAISEASTADSTAALGASYTVPTHVASSDPRGVSPSPNVGFRSVLGSVEASAGVSPSPNVRFRSVPGSVEASAGMQRPLVQRKVSAVRQEDVCQPKLRETLIMSSPILDHRAVSPTPQFRRCVETLDPRHVSPTIRCRGAPVLGPRDATAGLPTVSPLRAQVLAPWSVQSPIISCDSIRQQADVVEERRGWDGTVPCTWIQYSDLNRISRKGPGSPMQQQQRNSVSEYDFLKSTPSVPVARPAGDSGSAAVIAALRHCVEGGNQRRARQDQSSANVCNAMKDAIPNQIAAGHQAPALGNEAMRMEVTPSGHLFNDAPEVRRAPGQFSPERSASSNPVSRSTTPLAKTRQCRTPPPNSRATTPLTMYRQDGEAMVAQQHPLFEQPVPVTDWQPMERVGGRSMFKDRLTVQEKACLRPPRSIPGDVEESDKPSAAAVPSRRPRVEDIVNFYRDRSSGSCTAPSGSSCAVPCREPPSVQADSIDSGIREVLPEATRGRNSQSSIVVAPWERQLPCDRPSRRLVWKTSPVQDECIPQKDGDCSAAVSSSLEPDSHERSASADRRIGATIAQLADSDQRRAWDAGEDAYSSHANKNTYWRDWISIGAADIDCTMKRRSNHSPCDDRTTSPMPARSRSNAGSSKGRVGSRSVTPCSRSESRCARSASPKKTWQDIGLFEAGRSVEIKVNQKTQGAGSRSPTPPKSRSPTPTFRALAPASSQSKAQSAAAPSTASTGILPGMAGEAPCDGSKSDFWRRFYDHTGKHGEHGGADMDHAFKKKPGEFSPLQRGRQCEGSKSQSVERAASRSTSAMAKDGQHNRGQLAVAKPTPQDWREGASSTDLAFFDRSQSAPRTRKSPVTKHRCRGGSVETTASITASRCSFDEASSYASTALFAAPRESAQAKEKDSHLQGSPNIGRSRRAQRQVPAISSQPLNLFA